jgi:hypothetical protein
MKGNLFTPASVGEITHAGGHARERRGSPKINPFCGCSVFLCVNEFITQSVTEISQRLVSASNKS